MRQQMNKKLFILCGILVAVMVIEATWQVVTRYVFNAPSSWTDEILRFQLIWLTMLGAPLAHGTNNIMAVTVFTDKLDERKKALNKIIVEIVVLFFAVIVLIFGGLEVASNAYGQVSATLQINMFYVYLAVPISGIIFAIYNILNLKEYVLKYKEVK